MLPTNEDLRWDCQICSCPTRPAGHARLAQAEVSLDWTSAEKMCGLAALQQVVSRNGTLAAVADDEQCPCMLSAGEYDCDDARSAANNNG